MINYEKPRVLAIDFSKANIDKMIESGLNAKRASTGIFDNNEFSIPCSIQDVDITIFHLTKGCMNFSKRNRAESSVEDGPYFDALIQEIWQRNGWCVLFVDEGVQPSELMELGISNIGVFEENRRYIAPANTKYNNSFAKFPRFKGQNIITNNSELASILLRFLKKANFITFSVDDKITIFGYNPYQICIIHDDSKICRGSLATWLYHSISIDVNNSLLGGILILPSFGDHNVDVALALIHEYFSGCNTAIFSSPAYNWLNDYQPYPVQILENEKSKVIDEANKKVNELDAQIEHHLEEFQWLSGLLVGKDDEFTTYVATSLKFLGFRVEEVDLSIAPGERKREDLRIYDDLDGYFSLGEAKSTKRGASESFLTDVQNHQGRFSRENQCPIPSAILIVNHSYELSPDQRKQRFYTDSAINDRCIDQVITAIDSTVLYDLCQKVLQGVIESEQARSYIKDNVGILKAN